MHHVIKHLTTTPACKYAPEILSGPCDGPATSRGLKLKCVLCASDGLAIKKKKKKKNPTIINIIKNNSGF